MPTGDGRRVPTPRLLVQTLRRLGPAGAAHNAARALDDRRQELAELEGRLATIPLPRPLKSDVA